MLYVDYPGIILAKNFMEKKNLIYPTFVRNSPFSVRILRTIQYEIVFLHEIFPHI